MLPTSLPTSNSTASYTPDTDIVFTISDHLASSGYFNSNNIVFSALKLLVGRQKSIRPVKKMSDEVPSWLTVISLERGANNLHMVQLMPPEHLLHSLKSKLV